MNRFYWKWHVEIGLVVIFIGLIVVGVVLFATRGEVNREVRRGNQAHVALCAQKQDLDERVAQSRAFLRMTPAQRTKKFGSALASVPSSEIRLGLFNYERTLQSYEALRC